MTNQELLDLLVNYADQIEHFAIDDYSRVPRTVGYDSKYLIRIWVKDMDLPISIDEWRENLKAWNLKQREEAKIGSLDHAEKLVSEGQKAIRLAHYKGDF